MVKVEGHRLHLGREGNLPVTALLCPLHETLQQQRTDAAAAPFLQHGHAADVSVGQQAAGCDGLSLRKDDCMNRNRILVVQLDLARHALLFDEDRKADRRGERVRFVPGHELDSRHRAKSIIAA